jgi:hypothetical protein
MSRKGEYRMTASVSLSAWQRVLRLVPVAFLLTAVLPSRSAAAPSDAELWRGADARIERHRKTDATIVVRRDGRPVADAKIALRQTRHAFLFGSNIFVWGQCADAKAEEAYRKRFAELLNYATLPFYWPMYEPERGRPNHERTEKVARWCREQRILTRASAGMDFAERVDDDDWQGADCRWPGSTIALGGLRARRPVDVVNEATHFDRAEFLRTAAKLSDVWKRLGRVEFTVECFEYARKAGPKATLLINDYRTDPAYERLIEKLVDKQGKRLYDVIGIQSHMHGGTWPNATIFEVCDRFARFACRLHGNDDPPGERLQAAVGLGRRRAYRPGVRGSRCSFTRRSGDHLRILAATTRQARRLPRSDMSTKPLSTLRLIKQKWWTRESTSDQERPPDSAAAGDYRRISAGGKRKACRCRW